MTVSKAFKTYPSRMKGAKPKHPKCWKVCWSENRAKEMAKISYDERGTFTAYKCPKGKHWHIGHKQEES